MKNYPNQLKFSESGVRGVVGAGLTPQLVSELAAAFGTYLGGGRIVLGRDTRPTGEMFECAVTAGLTAVGCQVVRLGIVPTPTVQLMVRELDAAGGIAITASHNPAEWNALKFVGPAGSFLDATESGELFDVYTQRDFDYVRSGDLREATDYLRAFEVHRRKIFRAVDARAIRQRKFRVAADCCNGAGALFTAGFLAELGCAVEILNGEPTGLFSRPPEPIPEHLGPLAELVKEKRCDLGFAQDPDGDRLTLVDGAGRILSPQLTVALAFEHVLEAFPGPAAVNIQTTSLVERIARECGGELFYSKVGEINVVEKMREVGAEIGGEGNCGGVIWKKVHPGRDSYAGMAIILEMLALSGETLAEIVDSLPPCCNRSRRFDASPLQARSVVNELARRYADRQPLTFDGFRLNLDFGWILVRSSNTERILRLNVESGSEAETEALLDRFGAEIEGIMKEVKS